MINFIAENWYVIIWAVAILAVAGVAIYTFIKQPKSVQTAKIEEWLLFAVIEAEKKLGSGTGQIKLRMVYDGFLGRFPSAALIITFERFSKMVDKALVRAREILESNKKLAEYVKTKEGDANV